jgi:hypothetical protein
MSGFKGRRHRGHHRDEMDITTTDVFEAADRSVEKMSSVTVRANDNLADKPLWIGLKIREAQKVLGLTVGKAVWVKKGTSEARDAIEAFTNLLGRNQGERWTAYFVDAPTKQRLTRRMSRKEHSFKTSLTLSDWVATDPDAQPIPIVVCYAPDDPRLLTRKDLLVGHSIVPAPPRARQYARGKKPRRRS